MERRTSAWVMPSDAFFRSDVGMGHGGRVLGKRFGAAQTDCQLEQLQRVEKTKRLGFAAHELERDQPAGR